MRYVFLIFCLASSALAAEDKTISKQRLFQISCERGLMSFFLEYGNGSRPNRDFFVGARKACEEMTQNVTVVEWRYMTSPTESGCSSAVKALGEVNQGVPSHEQLFLNYCLNK